MYILPYMWQYDATTGIKTDFWMFSALDNTASRNDIEQAFQDGYISEQYKNAVLSNLYSGTPPKDEKWVKIV